MSAHWWIIAALIRGRFELTDQGPMDRTHMRWFTPSSYARMFEDAGFSVRELRPVTPFGRLPQLLSRATGGRTDHLFMRQIAVVATKR